MNREKKANIKCHHYIPVTSWAEQDLIHLFLIFRLRYKLTRQCIRLEKHKELLQIVQSCQMGSQQFAIPNILLFRVNNKDKI